MDKVLRDLKKTANECMNLERIVIRPDTPDRSQRSSRSSRGSPDISFSTPNIEVKAGKHVDSTNLWRHHVNTVKKKGTRLKLKKTNKEDPSCSPLFPDSHVQYRKKATKRSNSDLTPVRHKIPASTATFANNAEQFQRNSGFLDLLNTASVRQLQELQTVGVKRAKAIYNWRQLHGEFNFMDEIQQVPGFTDKYIEKLLQRNLVILPASGQ